MMRKAYLSFHKESLNANLPLSPEEVEVILRMNLESVLLAGDDLKIFMERALLTALEVRELRYKFDNELRRISLFNNKNAVNARDPLEVFRYLSSEEQTQIIKDLGSQYLISLKLREGELQSLLSSLSNLQEQLSLKKSDVEINEKLELLLKNLKIGDNHV